MVHASSERLSRGYRLIMLVGLSKDCARGREMHVFGSDPSGEFAVDACKERSSTYCYED